MLAVGSYISPGDQKMTLPLLLTKTTWKGGYLTTILNVTKITRMCLQQITSRRAVPYSSTK